MVGAVLVPARATQAAGTPEQTCQKGRYSVGAQYSACQQKVLAKFFAGAILRITIARRGGLEVPGEVHGHLAEAAGEGAGLDLR